MDHQEKSKTAEFQKISDRKIRFGLVGCGRISPNHIEAVNQFSEEAEWVAVCDPDSFALESAVKKTGAKGFKTLEELLQEASVDIVSICTPSGLHPEHAILAAKAGKHVVSEKPMAIRLSDGFRMVEACRKAGVRLFVVKQNRRNATLELLKQAMDQGRFGRIYMVAVNVFWTRPQSYYDQARWRGTRQLDGGALMNQASHYVDLLTWLVGPIDSLHAFTGTLARQIEMEDTAAVSIRWRSGAMGSMNVTMLTYSKNLEGSITILGEKGSVRVGGVAVNEIQKWEFSEARPEDEMIKMASYETTSVYGHGHARYYENVIRTLRGDQEPRTDGDEGLKSLETLCAMYLSAEKGEVVKLPLERGK